MKPPQSKRSARIIRTTKDNLASRSAGLVRRGLQEIAPWNLDDRLLELEPIECIVLHEGLKPITCAALSPGSRAIIAGDESGSVKSWDVSDLAKGAVIPGHEGPVTCVGFIGSERRVYSAGLDGIVRFLDRATEKSFELPRMGPITASDIANNGSIAVVGESQRDGVGADWINRGDVSIAGCRSGTVSAWDLAAQWDAGRRATLEAPLWKIQLDAHQIDLAPANPQCPTFIRISPDSSVVAFRRAIGGTNPGEMEIVRLQDGSLVQPRYWGSPSLQALFVLFSRGGRLMTLVTWLGLLLHEHDVGRHTFTPILLEEQHKEDPSHYESSWGPWWAPSAVSGTPDGRYLLLGSRQGNIRLYDVPKRRRILELVGHRKDVTAVGFFSNMKYVLSAGLDSTLRIWRLPQLESESGPVALSDEES